LLIRRKIADGISLLDLTPAGTPIETLVKVDGHRWAIEDSFETAKNELDRDHNETRSWYGWHRHVPLVMFAFAMLAAHPPPRQSPSIRTPKRMIHLTSPGTAADSRLIQEILRVVRRLARRVSTPLTSSHGWLWRRAHQAAARQAHLNQNATAMLRSQ
jgi:hypothetical protein